MLWKQILDSFQTRPLNAKLHLNKNYIYIFHSFRFWHQFLYTLTYPEFQNLNFWRKEDDLPEACRLKIPFRLFIPPSQAFPTTNKHHLVTCSSIDLDFCSFASLNSLSLTIAFYSLVNFLTACIMTSCLSVIALR